MTRVEIQWDGRSIGAVELIRFGRTRESGRLVGILEGELRAESGFEVCRDFFETAARIFHRYEEEGLRYGDAYHPARQEWENWLEGMRPHLGFPELGPPLHRFWFENGKVEASFGEFSPNDEARLGEAWYFEATVGWVSPGGTSTPSFWEVVAPLGGRKWAGRTAEADGCEPPCGFLR